MRRETKKATAVGVGLVPAWTVDEEKYWRENHAGRNYVATGTNYEDYAPAYMYGALVGRDDDATEFNKVESKAERGWTKARGKSKLTWEQARPAVRDAFDRTIQLRSERLRVDKETDRQAGEVKLKKRVRTDHKEMNVPVEREEVVIERRPVQRKAAGGDFRSEEIRIPVSSERVHVGKETVVREEVKVGKRKVNENRKVKGDVRREELVVESKGRAQVRQTRAPRKSR